LPTFSFRYGWCSWWCDLRKLIVLGRRWLSGLDRWRGCIGCPCGVTDPDENSVILINGKSFCLNQVDFQVFNILLIQVKPALQDAVWNTLLALKQRDDLGDKLLIVHGRYSTALAPLFRPARMP